MKKTMKVAAALAVLATPGFAANLENPLYAPKAGEVYSKTAAGVMYKVADDSLAMQAKKHDGATEFPIWRVAENLGYGITDRLSVRGAFGYTHDGDIDRQGMHEGRIGLNYRIFDGSSTNGFVWDINADAFLGGISKMKAELVMSPDPSVIYNGKPYMLSFDYENYANGRWGAWLGTKLGKTWGKFTGAAFAEVERTFGNDNNEIAISNSSKPIIASIVGANGGSYIKGLPKTLSVDTKSTWEYTAGLQGFYEFDSDWSLGGGFTYKHHSANSVEGVNIDVDATKAGLSSAVIAAETAKVASQFMGSMKDGWDEYILSLAVARQLTDSVQVALYGEYTFDSAEAKSQNGTDVKAELGVRLNAKF
ncbi:MAG: hypothetical protein LBL21_02120 [Rickettsiales bacterium]|jgi:hypothetical protein|nr:hypothetical protein [Rickettsiales bacterium]